MLALIASRYKHQLPRRLHRHFHIRPSDYSQNQTGLNFVVNLIRIFLREPPFVGEFFLCFKSVNSTLFDIFHGGK